MRSTGEWGVYICGCFQIRSFLDGSTIMVVSGLCVEVVMVRAVLCKNSREWSSHKRRRASSRE